MTVYDSDVHPCIQLLLTEAKLIRETSVSPKNHTVCPAVTGIVVSLHLYTCIPHQCPNLYPLFIVLPAPFLLSSVYWAHFSSLALFFSCASSAL